MKQGTKQRSIWGWGHLPLPPNLEVLLQVALMKLSAFYEDPLKECVPVPTLEDITLKAPRLALPKELSPFCTESKYERITHTYGKSFIDVVRSLKRDFSSAPDYVALPENEQDIQKVLRFAEQNHVAIIPFGGGTSVVQGVESSGLGPYKGVISLDLRKFNKVIDINETDRTGTFQAGIAGMDLESYLKRFNLSTKHYSQAFEMSTVGGWVATRGQGHLSTMFVHIDEMVENLRVVTPIGVMENRKLPGNGAGPDFNRMFIGSEGIFGIITQVTLKLHPRPKMKNSATVYFKSFFEGVEACRLISQSGIYPQNCRLIDETEAETNGIGDGSKAVLLLQLEGGYDFENELKILLSICEKCGGEVGDVNKTSSDNDKTSKQENTAHFWKNTFIMAPYLRDELIRRFIITETFETACPWSTFQQLHTSIMDPIKAIIQQKFQGKGSISCRFTAVYPSGPAPYFTILAKGKNNLDEMLALWAEMKTLAMEAILLHGGTSTHHHAIGRYHMPSYLREADPTFLSLLATLKAHLDPHGILNPGVLVSHPLFKLSKV